MQTNLTTQEQEELAKTDYPAFLKLAEYWRKTDGLYYTMYIVPLLEKYKPSLFQSQTGAGSPKLVLIFALAGFALTLGAALVMFMLTGNSASDKSTAYDVSYEVTGTAKSVLIIYVDEKNKPAQVSDVKLPWKKIISVGKESYLTLTALNQTDKGSLTARIFIDGKLIQESTTAEPHGTATVTGITK